MPKSKDFRRILVIGSGPIVIGQACEFDYSGTQAIKAIKQEGFEVVLINSNPATIMSDPEVADATYIEPITKENILKIIKKEQIDAILPTMGGQIGLNMAAKIYDSGVNVKFIGINPSAIKKGENRAKFKQAMENIGLNTAKSFFANDMQTALSVARNIGFPLIVRASFTLGGAGSGIANNMGEFNKLAQNALLQSPVGEILIEESLLGWEEFETEVICDRAGNKILVCCIENIDPVGIHTGDSICVAPALSINGEILAQLKEKSFAIMDKIGINCGGGNIQFALNKSRDKMFVIEMNPRLSRSSALASKATGYPIAKVCAKLALGYNLDEIEGIPGKSANFEPNVDYVVTKMPKFAFEKFPSASRILGTSMKSVGEVMALGANFKESLQKAICALEGRFCGFNEMKMTKSSLENRLKFADDERIFCVAQAFRQNFNIDEISRLTDINSFFLNEIKEIVEFEKSVDKNLLNDKILLKKAKEMGFSDERVAHLISKNSGVKINVGEIYKARQNLGIKAHFHQILPSYLYSSAKFAPFSKDKVLKNSVLIIASGANRIAQGIEFDYCCVKGVQALRDLGIRSLIINSNPETISTDYDTSDRLFFEPIDAERLRILVEFYKPKGVIVHFGGQTSLRFAKFLSKIGVKILGTSVRAIDIAENRKKFSKFITILGFKQPKNAAVDSKIEALKVAKNLKYPILARPSYVLGGKAMQKISNESEFKQYLKTARITKSSPLELDKFLQNAVEIDVDAICDKKNVLIGGILEHIEPAGIHSGDSTAVLPPFSLSDEMIEKICAHTQKIALKLGIVGLINIQLAICKNEIFIIEANPRASRTLPFISKAIGLNLAKIALCVMCGNDLKKALKMYDKFGAVMQKNGIFMPKKERKFSIKRSVFCFDKIGAKECFLGAEMKSVGEVMAIDENFYKCFIKSQIATNFAIAKNGAVLMNFAKFDEFSLEIALNFAKFGFEIMATKKTEQFLAKNFIKFTPINSALDEILSAKISIIIDTCEKNSKILGNENICEIVLKRKICYFTTPNLALIASKSLFYLNDEFSVKSLQEWQKR